MQELNPEDCMCITDDDEGELGSGLQTAVRLVHHCTLGWVAVKCFAVTGGPPEKRKLKEKVKKELKILQQAADDSVVRIYGWVKWPKAMGLVMEYLPAGSLRQFANDSLVKLTPKLILRMATEIASILARMHNPASDKRIIHGDLKPENILLTTDLHCKMSDFGSAELQALTGITTTTDQNHKKNKRKGLTMAYAAPEKLVNLNIKPKKEQDTYSFGMLLYVLLAGITPYQNPSQEIAFMELIKRGERPDTAPIDELKATLDSNGRLIIALLESIMIKCWQQDPSDRPSMIDVRDELQELRDQQNESEIMADVSEALKVLTVSKPIEKAQRYAALHYFSPMHGKFAQGTVYNFYNLPDAQQAAIGCSAVTFQSMGTDSLGNDQRPKNLDSPGSSSSMFSRFLSFFGRSRPSTFSDSADHVMTQQVTRKVKLNEVFEASDSSQLPIDVRKASDLLERYKNCLKKQKFEQAKAAKSKLLSLIANQIDATTEDVKLYADKLLKQERYLESIVIFDAAAAAASSKDLEVPESNMDMIACCVQGMADANEAIVRDDATMKVIVKDHAIPLMRVWLHHMEGTSLVSEQLKCRHVSCVLACIQSSEGLVDEREEQERTLRLAIARMRDVYGDDVIKKQGRLFGMLLYNLSCLCGQTSRLEEAACLEQQSVEVWEALRINEGNEREEAENVETQ